MSKNRAFAGETPTFRAAFKAALNGVMSDDRTPFVDVVRIAVQVAERTESVMEERAAARVARHLRDYEADVAKVLAQRTYVDHTNPEDAARRNQIVTVSKIVGGTVHLLDPAGVYAGTIDLADLLGEEGLVPTPEPGVAPAPDEPPVFEARYDVAVGWVLVVPDDLQALVGGLSSTGGTATVRFRGR